MWDFRHKFMLMVEGYLRLAGYKEIVAIMGLKFSFDLKSSKGTLCVFEIGVQPTKFHMILYELAYINISSVNVISDEAYDKAIKNKSKFEPNVKVKIDQAVICNPEFTENHKNGTYPQIVENSIKEAVEFYVNQILLPEEKRSTFVDRI